MCVIMVCKENKPSNKELKKAFIANPHGAGVAWYQDNKLQVKKGLNLKKLRRVVNSISLPFTIHFRWTTVGGTCKELTHGFVVSKESPILLEGTSDKDILFHNGHWSEYADILEQMWKKGYLTNEDIGKIGTKHISDTRIMAIAKSVLNESNFNDLVNGQKLAIMKHDKQDIQTIGTFIEENGILYSNQYFKNRYTYLDYEDTYDYDKEFDYLKHGACYKQNSKSLNGTGFDSVYDAEVTKWEKRLQRGLTDYELDDIWHYGYPLTVHNASMFI